MNSSFKGGTPFKKLSGAGNDFIFLDMLTPAARKEVEGCLKTIKDQHDGVLNPRADLARRLCRREYSIGADGLIFIESTAEEGCAFAWDFYNSDGSSAEMCGNAARCAGRWASLIGTQKEVRFLTGSGKVSAVVLDSQDVSVTVHEPKIMKEKLFINVGENQKQEGMLLDSGVPHFIIFDYHQDYVVRSELAQKLRKSTELGFGGANITFVDRHNGRFEAVTFERGVENFTKACGTGAIAAAAAIKNDNRNINIFSIQMPGGTLRIEFEKGRVVLSGDARHVYDGEFTEEAFKK